MALIFVALYRGIVSRGIDSRGINSRVEQVDLYDEKVEIPYNQANEQ
jgi:hypothetical protein